MTLWKNHLMFFSCEIMMMALFHVLHLQFGIDVQINCAWRRVFNLIFSHQ